jgi:hypothetical protein
MSIAQRWQKCDRYGCQLPGFTRPGWRARLCKAHWNEFDRPRCAWEGCSQPATRGTVRAVFCAEHYAKAECQVHECLALHAGEDVGWTPRGS